MKVFIVGLFFAHLGIRQAGAQLRCGSSQHREVMLRNHPELAETFQQINSFVGRQAAPSGQPAAGAKDESSVIKIPVIVHVLYHTQEENIPDEYINQQLDALNRDYRRLNSDSVNTPACFRAVATDTHFEFQLAQVDPQGRATTGIERVYTPVTYWQVDDKMKSSAQQGADGWDARYYLNIWVCNMRDVLGYSSMPGEPLNVDGVVIETNVFRNSGESGRYGLGRTAVHEIGHWLGLYHTWGDRDCGDDLVADTPTQATFTSGCPSGIRLSCQNAPTGDMYMNYMDYTDDPCMNLFTKGQSSRMRALFNPGGARYSILSSKALGIPTVSEIPSPQEGPRWLFPRLYPNPAHTQVILDLKYDARWVGRELQITSLSGQILKRIVIHATVVSIDISDLAPGIYVLHGQKPGTSLVQKLVKLP